MSRELSNPCLTTVVPIKLIVDNGEATCGARAVLVLGFSAICSRLCGYSLNCTFPVSVFHTWKIRRYFRTLCFYTRVSGKSYYGLTSYVHLIVEMGQIYLARSVVSLLSCTNLCGIPWREAVDYSCRMSLLLKVHSAALPRFLAASWKLIRRRRLSHTEDRNCPQTMLNLIQGRGIPAIRNMISRR